MNERTESFLFSCRNFEFIILRGGIKLLKKVFLSWCFELQTPSSVVSGRGRASVFLFIKKNDHWNVCRPSFLCFGFNTLSSPTGKPEITFVLQSDEFHWRPKVARLIHSNDSEKRRKKKRGLVEADFCLWGCRFINNGTGDEKWWFISGSIYNFIYRLIWGRGRG